MIFFNFFFIFIHCKNAENCNIGLSMEFRVQFTNGKNKEEKKLYKNENRSEKKISSHSILKALFYWSFEKSIFLSAFRFCVFDQRALFACNKLQWEWFFFYFPFQFFFLFQMLFIFNWAYLMFSVHTMIDWFNHA